jgi:pteridine reductase
VELARAKGVPAQIFQADLADPLEVSRLFENASKSFPNLDILILSASVFEAKSPENTDLEVWNRHIAVNLTARFILSMEFIKFRKNTRGTIIHLMDWRHERPEPQHFAYSITQSGIAAMIKVLARSAAPSIRVNGIAMGAILPPDGEPYSEETILRFVPMNRWGKLKEVIDSVDFLLNGPEYITGEILTLDGGRHLV